MTQRRHPAPITRTARTPKGVRVAQRSPKKLQRMYDEDDDNFDVPDTALGGAKD